MSYEFTETILRSHVVQNSSFGKEINLKNLCKRKQKGKTCT